MQFCESPGFERVNIRAGAIQFELFFYCSVLSRAAAEGLPREHRDSGVVP
jgi:hypothetical protein